MKIKWKIVLLVVVLFVPCCVFCYAYFATDKDAKTKSEGVKWQRRMHSSTIKSQGIARPKKISQKTVDLQELLKKDPSLSEIYKDINNAYENEKKDLGINNDSVDEDYITTKNTYTYENELSKTNQRKYTLLLKNNVDDSQIKNEDRKYEELYYGEELIVKRFFAELLNDKDEIIGKVFMIELEAYDPDLYSHA